MLQSLSMFAEAYPSQANNISTVIINYITQAAQRMVSLPFGDSWSGARGQDFALSLFWLLDNDLANVRGFSV